MCHFCYVVVINKGDSFESFLFVFFFSFFSILPSSVANSPILSRHGSPRILSTRLPSNDIVFRGCVKGCSRMGGSSLVIPSLLVESYRPSFTSPLALFPTTFAPLAFLVLCTLMAVIPRRFVYIPCDSSLVQYLDPEKLNLISAQIASFCGV